MLRIAFSFLPGLVLLLDLGRGGSELMQERCLCLNPDAYIMFVVHGLLFGCFFCFTLPWTIAAPQPRAALN